jgi:hypothetical protein
MYSMAGLPRWLLGPRSTTGGGGPAASSPLSSLTVVQWFGSGLELNVHFHVLGLDGVFASGVDGTLRFHRLPPPTDADVARLVTAIARRIGRLLTRRGLTADTDATDPLAAESLALAGLASAAVQGRLALGPRRRRHIHYGPGRGRAGRISTWRTGSWVSAGHLGTADRMLRYRDGRFERIGWFGRRWRAIDDGR